MATTNNIVTHLYDFYYHAATVVRDLESAGVPTNEVSIIANRGEKTGHRGRAVIRRIDRRNRRNNAWRGHRFTCRVGRSGHSRHWSSRRSRLACSNRCRCRGWSRRRWHRRIVDRSWRQRGSCTRLCGRGQSWRRVGVGPNIGVHRAPRSCRSWANTSR